MRVGFLFAGGVLLGAGGVLFWDTDAKCKSANSHSSGERKGNSLNYFFKSRVVGQPSID